MSATLYYEPAREFPETIVRADLWAPWPHTWDIPLLALAVAAVVAMSIAFGVISTRGKDIDLPSRVLLCTLFPSVFLGTVYGAVALGDAYGNLDPVPARYAVQEGDVSMCYTVEGVVADQPCAPGRRSQDLGEVSAGKPVQEAIAEDQAARH